MGCPYPNFSLMCFFGGPIVGSPEGVYGVSIRVFKAV